MSPVRKTHAGLIAGLALAGCSTDLPSADQAELSNISRLNLLPKSSPSQLAIAFHDFCIDGPANRAGKEAALRDASYVPTARTDTDAPQVFVVDDARPAIAVSETMCLAKARARTGQTERIRDYVVRTFPKAKPLATDQFSADIEQAWAVQTPAPGIVATQRTHPITNISEYAVIYYRGSATQSP